MDFITILTTVGGLVGTAVGVVQLYDYIRDRKSAPFRLEYRLSGEYGGFFIENRDDEKYPDYYLEHKNIILTNPDIVVDIVGQINESIKIAPYLVVEIMTITPLVKEVDYVYGMGVGGGGWVDHFEGVLSPYRTQIFGTPMVAYTNSGEERPVDYFTLAKGERESFGLRLLVFPGYYYKFRIGVLYSLRDKQAIQWIKHEFTAGHPSIAQTWRWRPPWKGREAFVKVSGSDAKRVFEEHVDSLQQACHEQVEMHIRTVTQNIYFSLPKQSRM
ncbi:MAG TPA: hypothetical protein VGD31_02055 [Sphingobacteriaceae bacterium]